MNLDTATQKLRLYYKTYRRLPSYGEMCELFHCASKRTGFLIAQKLIKAGIIDKDAKGKLIPKKLFPSLPVLGSIKAGFPTPQEQQLLETMSFDAFLVDNPLNSFILKVSGDSMVGAGIYPGDLVIIRKDKQPHNGDVVVAFIDDEWTLKYFRNSDGKTFLEAANTKYPTLYPQQHLEIWGIVTSVVRKYH